MRPLKINLLGFDSAVIQSEIPVLLVFGAVWDPDSRKLFYQLNWYAEKLEGKLKTGIVDYDYVPDIFSRYEVSEIPTLMIFEDGEPFERRSGYHGSTDIDKMIHHFFGYLPYSKKI